MYDTKIFSLVRNSEMEVFKKSKVEQLSAIKSTELPSVSETRNIIKLMDFHEDLEKWGGVW